jgi:hypothetical protein
MNKLPAQQKEILISFTAEQLDTMERKEMLQAYAQAIADGRDKPQAPAPTAIAPDPHEENFVDFITLMTLNFSVC